MKPTENKGTRSKILAASCLVMFVLGIMYVWSVFLEPIEQNMGWLRTQTGLVFSLNSFCWTLGNLSSGLCYRKLSVKQIISVGGIICCVGMLLSGFATEVFHLYIGYGFLVGIANGFVYNIVLSTCIKWYENQGLPTGILLMAYGIGGVILSYAAEWLIEFTDWRRSFHIVGLVMTAVILIGSFIITEPKKIVQSSRPANARELTVRDMVLSPQYRKHAMFSYLCATTGLIVLGSSAVCAMDMGFSSQMVLIAVSCANLCNGFGRVICGIVFDRTGRKTTMVSTMCLLLLGTSLLLLGRLSGNAVLALLGFGFTGLSYGFYCAFNPAYVSHFFGLKNMPVNNGFNCLVTSTASFVGPTISGRLFVKTGSYLASYLLMLGFIAVMTVVVTLSVKGPEYEKTAAVSCK